MDWLELLERYGVPLVVAVAFWMFIQKQNKFIQDELQKELREFAKKRDWEKFHNLKNIAISINLESSELLEIFQWENENSDFWFKKKIKSINTNL